MKIFKTKEYYVAAASGKLLTAGEDGLVTVEEKDAAKAQLWRFSPEADGTYRLVNVQSKKALDIIASGTVNGAWTHQWEIIDTNSQLWTIEEEAENVRLRSVSSGKYLDVALQDDLHVQIWEKGGENQLWTIEAAEKPRTDIKPKEPSAIKTPDPTAIKTPDPTNLKVPEPSAIKKAEPAPPKPVKTSNRRRGKKR